MIGGSGRLGNYNYNHDNDLIARASSSQEVLPQLVIDDVKKCEKMGGVWRNHAYNFDNVLYGFLLLSLLLSCLILYFPA
jgi:uncharacterized membrane protein affecting hemolysin expression